MLKKWWLFALVWLFLIIVIHLVFLSGIFFLLMQACKETFGDSEISMVIVPGQVCEKFFGEIESVN